MPSLLTLIDYRSILVTKIFCLSSYWKQNITSVMRVISNFYDLITFTFCFFMHHVTRMLESNAYVPCLLTNMPKSFWLGWKKLSKLHLPGHVINWLIAFLTGRSHITRCFGVASTPSPMNLNNVQGSGLRPTMYVVLESDLKIISKINIILYSNSRMIQPNCFW